MSSFYNSGRTEERPPPPAVRVLVCSIRCHGNACLASRWRPMDFRLRSLPRERAFGEPLSSNERFVLNYSRFQPSCHIAPFLRLSVRTSLSMYHRSFFSEVSARYIFLWLGFSCGDYSPTAPTAPSLRALVPSGSLIRYQSIQVHHYHPFFFFSSGGGQNYPEW
jgi:hypothetical protein